MGSVIGSCLKAVWADDVTVVSAQMASSKRKMFREKLQSGVEETLEINAYQREPVVTSGGRETKPGGYEPIPCKIEICTGRDRSVNWFRVREWLKVGSQNSL